MAGRRWEIATSRVDALTFGLGSGIAGIAGRGAVARSTIVSPNLGQSYIIDSFHGGGCSAASEICGGTLGRCIYAGHRQ